MSIELPLEGLMSMVPGVPPGLYFLVAFVMALEALRHLWGYIVRYAVGLIAIYLVITHPAIVNEAISTVVQTATHLLRG